MFIARFLGRAALRKVEVRTSRTPERMREALRGERIGLGRRSWGLLNFANGCLTADKSNCFLELGAELMAI